LQERDHGVAEILGQCGILPDLTAQRLRQVASQQMRRDPVRLGQRRQRQRVPRFGPAITGVGDQGFQPGLQQPLPRQRRGESEDDVLQHVQPHLREVESHDLKSTCGGAVGEAGGERIEHGGVGHREPHRAAAVPDEVGEILALHHVEPDIGRNRHGVPQTSTFPVRNAMPT